MLRIFGTAVANTLTGGVVGEKILGLGGNDTINGGGGADMLSGGTGNDSLVGGSGSDILMGGAGIDRLLGGTGDDTLFIDYKDTGYGGTGDDTIRATGGRALGGSGHDVFVHIMFKSHVTKVLDFNAADDLLVIDFTKTGNTEADTTFSYNASNGVLSFVVGSAVNAALDLTSSSGVNPTSAQVLPRVELMFDGEVLVL